jgi:hypothetical protein
MPADPLRAARRQLDPKVVEALLGAVEDRHRRDVEAA